MRVSSWSLPAVLLLADAQNVVAKAVNSPALQVRRDNLNDVLDQVTYKRESSIEARSPANQEVDQDTAGGHNEGELQIGGSPAEVNSTIAQACSTHVRALTNISNDAGFAGCYNILSWDHVTSTFHSDLRIYAKNPSTGEFANIAQNDILVVVKFPASTRYSMLTKRDDGLTTRENNETTGGANSDRELQHFSWKGSFSAPLDMAKLDRVQMASLITPQIALKSNMTGKLVLTNMTSDDMAMFVTGKFTDIANQKAVIADKKTAADAIAKSSGFVLPGTTFGIFPIGFIVTSIWTALFFIAYGAGTFMRYRYRDSYRRRATYLAGTNYNAPGIGKL